MIIAQKVPFVNLFSSIFSHIFRADTLFIPDGGKFSNFAFVCETVTQIILRFQKKNHAEN